MDVVPRITRGQRHQICNGVDNRFEETDGVGYLHWFHGKSNISNVNLKRAVRLLKYIRDREDNYIAKSIMLTTLAARTIQEGDRGRDQVKSVAATLTTILARMDADLQAHTLRPSVKNPANRIETFDRHWNDEQFHIFRESIHRYTQIARDALARNSVPESIDRWRRLFGPSFGRHWGATAAKITLTRLRFPDRLGCRSQQVKFRPLQLLPEDRSVLKGHRDYGHLGHSALPDYRPRGYCDRALRD